MTYQGSHLKGSLTVYWSHRHDGGSSEREYREGLEVWQAKSPRVALVLMIDARGIVDRRDRDA